MAAYLQTLYTKLHWYDPVQIVQRVCDVQARVTGMCLHRKTGWLFTHQYTPIVLYTAAVLAIIPLFFKIMMFRVALKHPSGLYRFTHTLFFLSLVAAFPLQELLARHDLFLTVLLYAVPLLCYAKWMCDVVQLYSPPDGQFLRGKTVIVTGSNTGIGYETAKLFAEHGATTVMACRSPTKGVKAMHDINYNIPRPNAKFLELDLMSLDSVRTFADEFIRDYGQVDIIVNNAGFYPADAVLTAEGLESGFGAMHVGHHLLTTLLLPYLSDNGRVVTVSSGLHRVGKLTLDDLTNDLRGEKTKNGVPSYARAKLANILFSNQLQTLFDISGYGQISVALEPGLVMSDIWRSSGPFGSFLKLFSFWNRCNLDAARVVAYASLSPEVTADVQLVSPTCYRMTPSATATENELAEALWEVTEAIVSANEHGMTPRTPQKTSTTVQRRGRSTTKKPKPPAKRAGSKGSGRSRSRGASKSKSPRRTRSTRR